MNEITPIVALDSLQILKLVMLGVAGFSLSMLLTPLYTTLAYEYRLWKKPRTESVNGSAATEFMKLHAAKHLRNIPTMAGVIFIVSVTLLTMMFNWSRSETWLPIAAFVGAAAVGLIDDFINIRGDGTGKAGLPTKIKLLLITLVAGIGGWYFYYKLGFDSMQLPGLSQTSIDLGWLIVPIFALVVVSTANAVNITDGLDGLAGGLTTIAFATYAVIATLEAKYGIAGFCVTMVGALMSYTWFNVFPARFFMGDVGSFALGTALGVVAMYTDTVLLLPLIGIVFVAEAGSVILQLLSKRFRGKKLFRVSPLHHHFEALGWPEAKVTMRFWVIGQVAALLGLALFVMGRYG